MHSEGAENCQSHWEQTIGSDCDLRQVRFAIQGGHIEEISVSKKTYVRNPKTKNRCPKKMSGPLTPPCCLPNSQAIYPKPFTPYKPPLVSRSEPLSHAEYLRMKKANFNCALSGNVVQTSVSTNSKYNQTIWTQLAKPDANVPAPTSGQNPPIQTPPIPSVHPGGKALDAGMLTMMEGSVAARGKLSHYDSTNRNEFNTTYRRQGMAIVRDPTYKAPAGAFRNLCTETNGCVLEGTTLVVPGNPDCLEKTVTG